MFMWLLLKHGPPHGYLPEPSKSVIICKSQEELNNVQSRLQDYNFKYCLGHRYLGGFLGSLDSQADWIQPKVAKWCEAVCTMSKAAVRYPQSAFAGLTKSLQAEWLYLQRVTPAMGPFFAPLEEALKQDFIPALFRDDNLPPDSRSLLGLVAKRAGIGIPNPVETAPLGFQASQETTYKLTLSLTHNAVLDMTEYCSTTHAVRTKHRGTREDDETAVLEDLLPTLPHHQQRRLR